MVKAQSHRFFTNSAYSYKQEYPPKHKVQELSMYPF